MAFNPTIKFQPDTETRRGLDAIASLHRIGKNGFSANEVVSQIAKRFGGIRPTQYHEAMAALEKFQKSAVQKRVRKRSFSDLLIPKRP